MLIFGSPASFSRLARLLVCVVMLSACSSKPPEVPKKAIPWTVGYWQWGTLTPDQTDVTVDALYVQAGTITPAYGFRRESLVSGHLPEKAAQAKEYWLTFRNEFRTVPDSSAALLLRERFALVREDAERRGWKVAGIQLDIDSPTDRLKQYAEFLSAFRQTLPPGMKLSITALLDWFRDGTNVGLVIEQVDEFVPQFYDVGNSYDGAAVAHPVEAAKWASRFNRFQKPYKIGLSTFGRGRLPLSRRLYRFITPHELDSDPKIRLTTDRTPARELVLNYDGGPERVQFILPTTEAVKAGVENARKMGGWVAGVVFFRWPQDHETLTLPVEEVLAAAGVDAKPKDTELKATDGGCAAVHCTDLVLMHANHFAPEATTYRIRVSEEIDYVVPQEDQQLKAPSSRALVVEVAPYAGLARMELGRVVTSKAATFTLEAE